MLQLSEDDLLKNRVVSEIDMNKNDMKWLKEIQIQS